MGNWNSGRRRQPMAVRLLRGNPGGHRDRLTDEPTPEPVTAVELNNAPLELRDNPTATAEWLRVAPILGACGILTQAERSALIALCLEWSRYLDPATAIFDTHKHAHLNQCIRLWGELGMTPASRAKLGAAPRPRSAPVSKWAKLA